MKTYENVFYCNRKVISFIAVRQKKYPETRNNSFILKSCTSSEKEKGFC